MKRASTSIKAIASGSLTNLLIWYDWYAYAAFAIYFSATFFPDGSQTVQLLQTAGIFALGFLMRPIGGRFLGAFADRYGRRKSLLLAVIMMSLGSLLIAVIPGYDSIGIYAPLLLLFARLLQGLSIGGGTGIMTTYLTEKSPPHRRGFYASFQYMTLVGGQIIALGLLVILQRLVLTEQELYDWGWRIPFVIGAVLSLGMFFMQAHLEETRAFKAVDAVTAARKRNIVTQLIRHPRSILFVVGLTMGGTLAFYTAIVYMQKYLINTGGLSKEDATLITFVGLLIFALIQPLVGALSDRIGRRPLLLTFGILGVLTTVPIMNALSRSDSNWEIFGLLLIYLVILSTYSSISVVAKAEIFPADVRVIGVGLPHAITVAVFGGTAEYVALWLKNAGHEKWFFWYITLAIFISLLTFMFTKDSRTHNKIDGEPHG